MYVCYFGCYCSVDAIRLLLDQYTRTIQASMELQVNSNVSL